MQHGNYDEFWQARNLRPHLKNIKPAVMTVGGWFDAENLFGALETYKRREANSPPAEQPPGHGAVGPRRLERAATATRSATCSSTPRPRDFYREQIEFPFFEYHLKGEGRRQAPEGVGLRDRHEPVAEVRRLAAEGARSRPSLYFATPAARLATDGRRRPADERPDAVRRVRQRPGQAGAVHRQDRHRHGAGVHDRRPALRRAAARRARLPDAGAGEGPDRRRADRGGAATSPRPAPTPTGS